MIACAVVSGVIDGVDIVSAQDDYDLFIVFEHQLERLAQFLRQAV